MGTRLKQREEKEGSPLSLLRTGLEAESEAGVGGETPPIFCDLRDDKPLLLQDPWRGK